MERYIVLTVKSGAKIKLQFAANKANTMVKVVSGSNEESITIDTDKSEAKDFQVANDATTIYGDVSLFNCRQNGNNLTGINLSKNDGIRELRRYNNQIEELDISMQKDLEALFYYETPIKTTDVSHNQQLKTLACRNMELKTLDVTNNSALEELLCQNNQLSSLDVSKNTKLVQL